MSKALIVIDPQNDYFPGGLFPLWNMEVVLKNIEGAIALARSRKIPVILVQHVASPQAPFFKRGSKGVEIHPRIQAIAANDPVVVKEHADGFYKTNLDEVLTGLGVNELVLCGMMTQNCVTHTAISKSAEKYSVAVLADCTSTVSEMIHLIALNALSTRVTLGGAKELLC